MDILIILGVIAFGVATVLAFIEKAWALALVGLGLFLVTLASSSIIHK